MKSIQDQKEYRLNLPSVRFDPPPVLIWYQLCQISDFQATTLTQFFRGIDFYPAYTQGIKSLRAKLKIERHARVVQQMTRRAGIELGVWIEGGGVKVSKFGCHSEGCGSWLCAHGTEVEVWQECVNGSTRRGWNVAQRVGPHIEMARSNRNIYFRMPSCHIRLMQSLNALIRLNVGAGTDVSTKKGIYYHRHSRHARTSTKAVSVQKNLSPRPLAEI